MIWTVLFISFVLYKWGLIKWKKNTYFDTFIARPKPGSISNLDENADWERGNVLATKWYKVNKCIDEFGYVKYFEENQFYYL